VFRAQHFESTRNPVMYASVRKVSAISATQYNTQKLILFNCNRRQNATKVAYTVLNTKQSAMHDSRPTSTYGKKEKNSTTPILIMICRLEAL